MTDEATDEVKPGRKNQPKCGTGQPEGDGCQHPVSFHGGGNTGCKALGCHCEAWVAPAENGAGVPV